MAIDYRKWAWLVAVISTLIIEYVLIIPLSFSDPFATWWSGGYIFLWVFVVFIIYWRVFLVRWWELFIIMFAYSWIVCIPIGLLWALIQGYDWSSQLMNFGWYLVHDFGYVYIAGLFAGVGILLWGGYRVRWKKVG